MIDMIEAGRRFLRTHQPEAALHEFEAAYDASASTLANSSADDNPAVRHSFINASYWRSAAFNQLHMMSQADEQTSDLLRLTTDERTHLDATEHGLIHYARGRYYLERHAAYDAIACFENALNWDATLERALRDRIQAYRSFDAYAALYYAMLAVQGMPESFELRHIFVLSLLDAKLWGLAEHESRGLMADYPHQQPTALTRLAQAVAGQGRITEALEYCTRALELDDKSPEASEQMALLILPASPSTDQVISADTEIHSAMTPLLEPELIIFVSEMTESVIEWLEEAFQCQNAQDYAGALKLFDLILEYDTENVEAACGRINCLRLTHKFSEAKSEAEGAIDRNLASWELYVELGRLLHAERNYATALGWYDKADAVGSNQGNIEITIARSNTLCAQGNTGAAGDLIDELLKLNTGNFALLEEQAWIAFSRGDYGDAESSFHELYTKAYADFHASGDTANAAKIARMSYGLGYVAMKQGDNFGALSHFFDAKEMSNVVDYQLAHVWAQAQCGKTEELEDAKNTCRELVRRTGSPLAHNCLGVLYFKLGYPTDAKTHFEIAAKISPTDACHVDLGALYASLEDTDAAESEFRKAIKIEPNDGDAHYELGVLMLSGQNSANIRTAEREFRRAKAIDQYSTRAVLALSRCYRIEDRLDDAEQELSRAIKKFEQSRHNARQFDLWRLHVELAAILIDRGNRNQNNKLYGKAYGEARAAINLAGAAWEAHYVAAVAAERCGHFRAAASHWRDCRERGADPASIESLGIDVNHSRIEARTQIAVPMIAGLFAFFLFIFVVLDLTRLDQQPMDVLLIIIASFITTLMIAVFPNRLVKFSIAKVVTAELAVLADQSLPVGPIGQLPAVSSRFDLPLRPFGQQPRRN